jgi:pimeloyl-ACP methyl ester carboxylesterase
MVSSQEKAGMVVSRDGTRIAFDRYGAGPVLILIGGAFTDRLTLAPLAQALAPHFSAVAYDRRGRGESGDTAPYAVSREVEDLAAVISVTGQPACVFGHSSGAALALQAAADGLAVGRLALYEPPYIIDDARPPAPADFAARLAGLVASGRRGDALEYWMEQTVRMPAPAIAQMRDTPAWPALEARVHTAPYEATIMAGHMSGRPLPAEWAELVTVPTLVMDGEKSEAWQHHSAQALAELLPSARRQTFPGADHGVAPDALVPVLRAFCAAT